MSRGAHQQELADVEAPIWFAVFLPRAASEPIIRKLNQAAFATADTPSVQEHLNVLAAPIHRGADFGG
jgi:tripartite-type tricarboxylate transporter receptor subunit TctC